MEGQENEFGKIVVKWEVSSFLPIFEEEEEIGTVYETLDSEVFRSEADIRSYWSIPERLIDTRWLAARLESNGDRRRDLDNPPFDRFIELEYNFYRLVATIGVWGGVCAKNIKKLKGYWDGKNNLISFWQQYGAILEEWALQGSEEEAPVYSEEDIIRLYRLSEKIPFTDVEDDRKQSLSVSVKLFRRRVEKIFGSNPEPGFLLETIQPDELQEFFRTTADCCEKIVDFFTNTKWRREDGAVKSLHKLEKNIQRVLPDWKPADEDKWSDTYHNSLWEGLQEAANVISARFRVSENRRPVTVETMLRQVTDVLKLLGSEPRVKKTLEEYAGDRGRCVALLEAGRSERVMAFSGFLDCEDKAAQTALNVTFCSDTVDAFRRISKKLHAVLAILSEGVVDHMIRIEPDSSCRLTNSGTLRDALTHPPDRKRQNF